MSPPTDADQLQFLADLQRILDEGSFVATYKYALLHALADIAVLRGDESGDALEIETREIAEQFVRLYWHQAAPYQVPGGGDPVLLRQNTGKPAAILNAVASARTRAPGPFGVLQHRARHTWRSLVSEVDGTVRRMPLGKLQTVGTRQLPCLYRIEDGGRSITLLPGVAFCLRRFHGLVRDLVRGAWLGYVRRHNQPALGNTTDLAEFLFPGARTALGEYVPVLRDVQGGDCFYCRTPLRRRVDVDHFIPFSRYPRDLGHNFVLAHAGCNRAKSDHLASEEHLELWDARNRDHADELAERFAALDLPADDGASRHVARWAYGQVERSGGQVWVAKKDLRPLTPHWRAVLRA